MLLESGWREMRNAFLSLAVLLLPLGSSSEGFSKAVSLRLFFVSNAMTIAVATTKDYHCLAKMRALAATALATTNEPGWLANLFLFTPLAE